LRPSRLDLRVVTSNIRNRPRVFWWMRAVGFPPTCRTNPAGRWPGLSISQPVRPPHRHGDAQCLGSPPCGMRRAPSQRGAGMEGTGRRRSTR
jgi:hypothetical protein